MHLLGFVDPLFSTPGQCVGPWRVRFRGIKSIPPFPCFLGFLWIVPPPGLPAFPISSCPASWLHCRNLKLFTIPITPGSAFSLLFTRKQQRSTVLFKICSSLSAIHSDLTPFPTTTISQDLDPSPSSGWDSARECVQAEDHYDPDQQVSAQHETIQSSDSCFSFPFPFSRGFDEAYSMYHRPFACPNRPVVALMSYSPARDATPSPTARDADTFDPVPSTPFT